MPHLLIRAASTLAIGALLAACNPAAVPEQLPFAEPGVEFAVDPAGQGCDDDGTYVGTVSWDVPGALASKFEVQVGAEERKVFTRSNDNIGSEQTGPWTAPGMVFVLVDRQSDMLLAALEAGPGNCEAP